MLIRSVLITTVLLALPALASPAGAQTGNMTTASRSVGYADLNLVSPAGAAALEQRIDAAASAVCAPEDYRDLKQLSAAVTCKQAALDAAHSQSQVAIANARSAAQTAAISKGGTAVH